MEEDVDSSSLTKPNPIPNPKPNSKPKVVVVMGATGSGKSRLAIDLASYFPIEIINADSMQVYQGLDVLTNKVPLTDRNGVPHHLLGSICANVDFTAKDFRDLAIPIIDDILFRKCLPTVVGGTNYYVQALVSSFLLDDMEDLDECRVDEPVGDLQPKFIFDWNSNDLDASYDILKELDPAAANRIHPNDLRKIRRYLDLYASLGVLPSTFFQRKGSEKWGQADNFRYDCCFLWVDASLPALDRFVEQRVDSMIDAGLLGEVFDIYNPSAIYTRGLRQAIGVREFENFLKFYLSNANNGYPCPEKQDCRLSTEDVSNLKDGKKILKDNLRGILCSDDKMHQILLREAVDKLKANTRKLVRRQKRRLKRLESLFGWNLHYVDATEALLRNSGNSWLDLVVEPCVNIVKSFLCEDASSAIQVEKYSCTESQTLVSRNLWTQYICEACGNRILRGAHEWEQHIQGRGHRKRISQLRKKSQGSTLADQFWEHSSCR